LPEKFLITAENVSGVAKDVFKAATKDSSRFDESIRAILNIVQDSNISSVDKEEIVAEVVAINNLAN
jgi:hypothetical protein